ncbi:hypothetical protein L1D14_03905 [Vibrio tubiashii]|uniref:hypothetical protein n=1 Tax=Vibrio tubiashii TaxID=29498 RepID=UPI001EFC6E8B|nr:hypothetical protein [Vibrio tubiashii]MCG9575375.1 hypothetical protein [Vibrio tubiashii]
MVKKKEATTTNFGQTIDPQVKRQKAQEDVALALSRVSDAMKEASKSGLGVEDFRKLMNDEQRALFESQIESGAASIQLPLGQGFELITFRLHEIAPEDIETKTRIHKSNIRLLKYFSDFDKAKCVDMLKLRDPNSDAEVYVNTTPTLACVGENGVFDIFDGLRRRYGAIGASCTLKVYVTEDRLTDFHAQLASDKNNDHLTNGFLDRREQILSREKNVAQLRKLEDLPALSDRKMAIELGINSATLSLYKNSTSLPDELLCAFPSPTSLGKPTIRTLMNYVSSEGAILSNPAFIREAVKRIRALSESFDADVPSDSANKKAMSILAKYAEEVAPKPKKNTSVHDYGFGSIARHESGETTINLTELTEDSLEELVQSLKALMGGK